jgi:hypothetical protein
MLEAARVACTLKAEAAGQQGEFEEIRTNLLTETAPYC